MTFLELASNAGRADALRFSIFFDLSEKLGPAAAYLVLSRRTGGPTEMPPG
jgi:hypothetical protein